MKKIEELKELLIVIDMINGFIKEGAMSDEYIKHIVPEIERKIDEIISKEEGLIFVRDTHTKESKEFKKFPEHCLKGTRESELIQEFKKYEEKAINYEKNSTSLIFAEGFMKDLEKMHNLKEVVIAGCCTDICIMNAAIPLINYFDQNNLDVEVKVPSNLVETYNSDEHNREEYNNMALKLMKQSGIKVGRY